MKYYLGMYDISCNKVREKVRQVLCAYGIHQQKSVFECQLSDVQKQELVQQLEVLVESIKTNILFIQIFPHDPNTLFFGQARQKIAADCLYIG